VKKLPKILIYFSILIMAIFLSISITKNYVAHVYLSEYKSGLNEKRQDARRQGYFLKRSLEFSRSNAETLFELGKLYADENSIGKSREDRDKSYGMAKEFLEASLMRKPTDGRNRAEYAWYIGSSGETNEAIEQFNMAINSDPTYAYLHMLYAMWCVNQVKEKIDITNTAQFVEKYGNAQRKDETLKSYDGRSINGVSIATFLRTGQMEWDKALSLGARRYQDEYESLADLNLLGFEIDKSISNYKRADNKLMLTRCYIIKGNYNKAVNILGLIIEEEEEGKFSGVRLAKIKKLLLVVIDHDPNNYRSFYCLGKIHTRLGETEQAISNYKSSIHLNPKHIDSHLNLAELYNEAGKIDLAIEEYETILGLSPNHKEATQLLSEAIMFEYKDAEFLKKP